MKYVVKNDQVVISVKDTGIGIAKETQEIIFERFRQANSTIAANYGGTGLGLAISRSFVQMIGGDLTVESIPGEGSEFKVTLPYSAQEFNPENKEFLSADLIAKPITILISEDEINNYKYLQAILESKNITLLRATDGFEAVNICENNPNIDLVLMDIKMPVMDGIEALKRIRKFRANLPIIAQTAYALEHDRQEFLAMGFTDYIAKPIVKEELLKMINQVINNEQ
jgi:CheY-like chemotaxis protein